MVMRASAPRRQTQLLLPAKARFDRDTLAGLPLEKLAYFRPPWTSEPHSLQRFLEDPDMSWGYEGVGDTSGRTGPGGGVAAELLSIEAMEKRGFLGKIDPPPRHAVFSLFHVASTCESSTKTHTHAHWHCR